MADFVTRFEALSEKTINRKFFDGVRRPNQKFHKDELISNLLNALPDSKTNLNEDTEFLVDKGKDLQLRYDSMQEQYNFLEEIASKSAKRVMTLGLFTLCGYFGFVFAGTYYIWSWDIVEPLAYFILLTGTIGLSYQYFKLRKDFTSSSYHAHLTQKYIRQIADQYRFDLDAYAKLQTDLKKTKQDIKNNILSDL